MRIRAFIIATALFGLVPGQALAAPTCPEEATRPLCGGRIVAEPESSTTFLQFNTEFVPVLEAIEALAPDIIEVATLAELNGDPAHVSAGGRELWVVRVTDESVTGPKLQAAASLSIHANESAGREGGVRWIEDLARWWVDDPEHILRSGDAEFPLSEVLARTETYFGFPNPDGWAMGDLVPPGGIFMRGNADGIDLNRQFPTPGWMQTENRQLPLTEPEAIAWYTLIHNFDDLTTATDIHGELTSATDSFADIMYPAGQWDPTRQAQELQFAQHMEATIERRFADEGILLQELLGPTVGQDPATYATAYDIVGYDDSGFMGDWFVREGAVEMDVENFLSHLAPGNVWLPPLEQAHVAAVRGILESLMVEALVTGDVQPDLDLGRVAYVLDPRTVSSQDGDGFGYEVADDHDPLDYDATRMRYFDDLALDAGVPITPLSSHDLPTADFDAFDTVVLSDVAIPPDPSGRAVDHAAYVAALDGFVRDGGQLLLTDGALSLLVDLGLFAEDDLTMVETNAGHVDFGAFDHPWEQQLSGLASQTYYEVPLGFPARDRARHFGVATAAWEEAGGTTAGTVESDHTILGDLPHGDGTIAVFGAILPTQLESEPHLYGIKDYGVTVAGGQVLHAILSYRRPGGGGGGPSPSPTSTTPTTGVSPTATATATTSPSGPGGGSPSPGGPGGGGALPTTGGGIALAGLLVAAIAARRRTR